MSKQSQRLNDDPDGASGISSASDTDDHAGIRRRDFLKEAGAIAGSSAAVGWHGPAQASELQAERNSASQMLRVELTINDRPLSVQVDSRTTLLDLLREQLHLMGTKKGCDQGACGACTVLVDGQRVLSCLTLAATLTGKQVVTIEGLAKGEELHPLQEAFLRCDAYQCGYCTPGQIMSGIGCIQEGRVNPSVEETREWMSGNLCRCSAYPNIVAAVRQVAGQEDPQDPALQVTRFDASTEGRDR